MSTGPTTGEVPREIVAYLDEGHTMTLATASSGGIPRASTFLYVNDGPTLYFWTRPMTTTARHVEQNPIVSFAIDDYSEDLNKTRGAQGLGECSVVLSGEQIARVADLFGQKFPSLSPGSTMAISFFRIVPTELQFIDNTVAAPAAGDQGGRGGGTFGAEFHRDRSFSVVADLPAQPVGDLTTELQGVQAKAGETISRQGGPADKFFIVVEGEAEVVREESDGESVIAKLSPGTLFGDVALMRNRPRAASVRATTDTTLLTLERDAFRDLVAQSMGITAEFDQVIRSRLDSLGSE
jgi:uncharacterized protein YhbP (UPF0306 family)